MFSLVLNDVKNKKEMNVPTFLFLFSSVDLVVSYNIRSFLRRHSVEILEFFRHYDLIIDSSKSQFIQSR